MTPHLLSPDEEVRARRQQRLLRLAIERADRPRQPWIWIVLLAFLLGLLVGLRLHALGVVL